MAGRNYYFFLKPKLMICVENKKVIDNKVAVCGKHESFDKFSVFYNSILPRVYL